MPDDGPNKSITKPGGCANLNILQAANKIQNKLLVIIKGTFIFTALHLQTLRLKKT